MSSLALLQSNEQPDNKVQFVTESRMVRVACPRLQKALVCAGFLDVLSPLHASFLLQGDPYNFRPAFPFHATHDFEPWLISTKLIPASYSAFKPGARIAKKGEGLELLDHSPFPNLLLTLIPIPFMTLFHHLLQQNKVFNPQN